MSLHNGAVSRWLSVAAVLALASCAAWGGQPPATVASPVVTLVADGNPAATIVVSADAGKLVRDAVADLQLHLEKMSGIEKRVADMLSPSLHTLRHRLARQAAAADLQNG